MIVLSERNEAIDLVTLKEALAQAGEIDQVGGPVYISSLVDGVPRSTNVEYYARIVKEKSTLRALIHASTQIAQRAWEAEDDPNVILDDAERTIFSIAEDRARAAAATGLPEDALTDAVDVALEGQRLAVEGIPQLVEGVIPNLGMLGFLIAYAKVGKTTFDQAMAADVAMGRRFLDKPTVRARVLVIAAEDPPEYTAWVARHLAVDPGWMTFYRKPILLDAKGLAQILTTVRQGNYGFVLIASWQAVVRGLIRDENDNAGAVRVVEDVKAAARASGVPWLIDAHSGKGEDQADDADPSRAMRGASAAAGAADYSLNLRYANGAFGTQRKLSGKGRFVSVEPILMEFDAATGAYTAIGSTKNVMAETTWRLIADIGALTLHPQTAGEIAKTIGLLGADGRPTNTHKRQVAQALLGRHDVFRSEELRNGKKAVVYRLVAQAAAA